MSSPAYHGWTHAPKARGGTDPIPRDIPCFRAYQYDIVQQINDNNAADLRFDRYQNSHPTIFDTGFVPGTPDYIDTISILERGLYLFHVFADPQRSSGSPALAGKIGLSIEDSASTYTGPPGIILDNTNRAGDGTTGALSWTVAMSFPPVWGEQTSDTLAPDLPSVQFVMLNLTGATIDSWSATHTMIEIHQLYAFDYETLEVQAQA